MRPTLAKLAPLLRTEGLISGSAGKASPIEACGQFIVRHSNPRLLIALMMLAIVLTASAHFVEHQWSSWLAQKIPASWAKSASVQTLQRLDKTVLEPTRLSVERQNIIYTRFAALRLPEGAAPLYELVFRHGGGLGAKSFTLAGGQIVATDEWINQFKDDRDLLAALAVQLGHLKNRDALRRGVDHAPMRALLALFRSDAHDVVRMLGEGQPVLKHDEHCEEAAQAFGEAVMDANPPTAEIPRFATTSS